MKWVPHDYQRRGIEFMLKNPAGALFIDMGLGKTSISLAAFKVLQEKGVVKSALVVAPIRVCLSVWPREVEKWDQFDGLRVSVVAGGTPQQRIKALQKDADIYVVNPEQMVWLAGQKWKLPDMLIIDESTKFKNSRSQRFKALRPLLAHFKRRYILTGTPAPNGLLDLFGQMFLVDLGASLGRFITHYRNQYFIQGGYQGYEWFPKSDSEARIYEKIAPYALRMSAADYLKMPPIQHIQTPVQLPRSAWNTYLSMEQHFLAQIENDVITAANAGAKSVKLRQITNGRVYNEEGVPEYVHSAKVDALEEIVEELQGKPVLVFYEFDHDCDAIVERFKCPALRDVKSRRKQDTLLAQWNAGELPMLALHPASGGHGLNLQEGGNHAVWFGQTWNLEYYEQAIARIHRQGQKNKVIIHHLIAEGTVDEIVVRTIQGKQRTQKALFDALKKDMQERARKRRKK